MSGMFIKYIGLNMYKVNLSSESFGELSSDNFPVMNLSLKSPFPKKHCSLYSFQTLFFFFNILLLNVTANVL